MLGARDHAPRYLGPYRTLHRSWIGKLWTGNPDLHYEVWPRPKLGVVEIGLHFESDRLTNARLLGAFHARRTEVRRALGDAPRIEAWDKGWARIYEAHPFAAEAVLADRLADRVSRYVAALEPILRDELPADVSWRARG